MKNIILSIFAFISSQFTHNQLLIPSNDINVASASAVPISSPAPTTVSSPTPRPLTFDEQNKLYGPCVRLPVLMYHHIQTEESAKSNKQTGLSVYTGIFKKQMEYLSSRGYTTVGPEALINFFNSGAKIPTKSVVLTFDDGYEDFFTDAYPILRSLNFKATTFIPTGLVGNNGYLNWDQIKEMSQNNIYIANHTWSHKNMAVPESTISTEISTANKQLGERGFDQLLVFAYPYGTTSLQSQKYLAEKNYNLAFTTQNGSILCKKNKLNLPRLRVGNRDLSAYGF